MSKVYFIPVPDRADPQAVSAAAVKLLETLTEQEQVVWEKQLPLKCHFGEKGNRSYLKPENFSGLIDWLEQKGVDCCFIETSVLYGGERFERDRHIALARQHGFTRLPVVIADGAHGEEAENLVVNLRHFTRCAVASRLAAAPQVLVLSHFKGHMLAGFGGAIKQLGMGFAAKGGKMAMHMGVKPRVRRWKCVGCGICLKRCNEQAISLCGGKASIDHKQCVGCGACFSICPHKAISILSLAGIKNALFRGRLFREKLVEYAYAAHNGKRNVYLNFAISITKGCDCEPRPMSPVCPDIGIFASLDPVAADAACYAAAAAKKVAFRGREQLDYAEKIGLGTADFELITVKD